MTEEQKQALIGLCRIEIRRWEAAAEAAPEKKYMAELMRIALDALTAPPVACKKRLVNHRSEVAHHWTYHGEVDRPSSGDIFRVEVVPLYEHAAPAADLADLMPVITRLKRRYVCNEGSEREFIACVTPERSSIGTGQVWDDWRELSAILRKIEEAE